MKKNNEPIVYRGEIYYADLSPAVGSEQGGIRPVLIIQNNTGNRHAPTTIVAPITSRMSKHQLPTHIQLSPDSCELSCKGIVLLEQVMTIDKQRLGRRLGALTPELMKEVNEALAISIGLK